jgi:hypothetical protein
LLASSASAGGSGNAFFIGGANGDEELIVRASGLLETPELPEALSCAGMDGACDKCR